MPQMSPLSWAPLMIITTTMLILVSAALFWNTMQAKSTETHKNPKSSLNWKW